MRPQTLIENDPVQRRPRDVFNNCFLLHKPKPLRALKRFEKPVLVQMFDRAAVS
jgi:hypothetical protein